MTHDHLNAISNLILIHTGVKVFNNSDNKSTKINKLLENIGTTSSRLVPTLNVQRRPVSKLLDMCKESVSPNLSPRVPSVGANESNL